MAVAAALETAVVYSAFAVVTAQIAGEIVENFVPLAGAWFIADSVAARRRAWPRRRSTSGPPKAAMLRSTIDTS